MATRVTDGASTGEAAALVSRVSRLRRSRARALLSLNLKKKRDYSQSTENEQKIQSVTKLVETLCPEGHISCFFDTVYCTSTWKMKLSLPIPSKQSSSKRLENCTFLYPILLKISHQKLAYKWLCFAK